MGAQRQEFIFDLQGHIVLHGCWAMSLCSDRPARRFRTPAPPPTVWREQTAHDVPKLQTAPLGPLAAVASALRRSKPSELAARLAEKQNFPQGCELLLEFWQDDCFLGETSFQCSFGL